MFFGSHFGDWTRTDNIMRAALATPSIGLASCIVGLPHWFCHHMALGEPIGYAARLTMNNTSLYQNQSNALPRAVFINLLGDPTLRMESVAPVSELVGSGSNGSTTLTWLASTDPVVGYHVYRSASADGPFLRLTPEPVQATSFTDLSPPPGASLTYMVRAIALQENPSGSYFNPSEGKFVQVDPAARPNAVLVSAIPANLGLELTWNAQTNARYRVQSASTLQAANWTNLTVWLPAVLPAMTYVDTNRGRSAALFYRVVSE
jgi:hypothetical protein